MYESENKQDALVNARELHEALGVADKFATWITRRIERYGFESGVDFFSLRENAKREIGATTRTEYLLKLDTAKEIAMVENNEAGRK